MNGQESICEITICIRRQFKTFKNIHRYLIRKSLLILKFNVISSPNVLESDYFIEMEEEKQSFLW